MALKSFIYTIILTNPRRRLCLKFMCLPKNNRKTGYTLFYPKDFDKSMYWLEKSKSLGNQKAEELMVYCRFFQLMEN